jgi:hypothetical protein
LLSFSTEFDEILINLLFTSTVVQNDIPETLDVVKHVEEALEAVRTSELFDELGRLPVLPLIMSEISCCLFLLC